MTRLALALPGNDTLADALATRLDAGRRAVMVRQFPDGETLVRVDGEVRSAEVIIAATLHHPDTVVMPLYFLASTLRELGAARIVLVAPYLPCMRQDKPFHPGEGTTARYFAHWLSSFLDGLVTVDPHLHRIHSLAEIYTMPTVVVPAAPAIARWLHDNLPNAVLIGPDAESEQWVADVARQAGCPWLVLEKTRRGDRDVSITAPHIEKWRAHTPVLLDDIVSTGCTMAAAAHYLLGSGMPAPVGIAVHAVLAEDALAQLKSSGIDHFLSTNTIAHISNAIDLNPLLATALVQLLDAPGNNGST